MTNKKPKHTDQENAPDDDAAQFEKSSGTNEAIYDFKVGADSTAIDGRVFDKGDTIGLTASTAARLRHGGIKLDCDAETEAAVQVAHDILFNAAPS